MFPFDNIFQSFNISGAELLATLQILQSGDKGLYQFSGIQTTVMRDGDKFKFISAKMSDGSEIDPNKYYIGIASDFLLGGGDDFKDVINKVYTPRDVSQLG
jgi:2',3'-cyclic-nucleotide 2'-phosphodiesterase (5'-nucleotidase family)